MKKVGKKKRVIIIVAVILFIVLLTQAFLAGWLGGMGPLGFLREYKYSRMPGNNQMYNPDTVVAMENSPLEGETICFLGSSVTAGSASLGNSMADYLGKRFAAETIVAAVSGTTLVDNGKTSYVQRLQANIDSETSISLFICQLSTNDASKEMPLGDLSEGYTLDDFDTTTITGALEFIVCYAQETWGCPVMIYTGSRYDSPEYAKMVTLLPALQEKWGIGVIDLWNSDVFNSISDEERALYMDDDIHPTMAGYKEWWSPEMERQILAFLN